MEKLLKKVSNKLWEWKGEDQWRYSGISFVKSGNKDRRLRNKLHNRVEDLREGSQSFKVISRTR